MITAISIELLKLKLENGIKKAEKLKPEIQVVSFGFYKVSGSKGNWYKVTAGRTSDNQFFVACTCPGALHQETCYHEAAAFTKHRELAQKMIDEKNKVPEKDVPYLRNHVDKVPERVGDIKI